MKIKLVLVMVLIGFMSCSEFTMQERRIDWRLSELASGHDETYFEEWDEFENYHDIVKWMNQEVSYRADFVEEWSNPYNTVRRGYGDCDDFALLFMNIAKVALDIEMDAVVLTLGRAIENGGGSYDHLAVRYNGEVIEPRNGQTLDYEVQYYFTYNEVFK